MKITDLCEQSGLHIDWFYEFVRASNKIDPQPGYENEPGSPRFDRHLTALYHVVEDALESKLAKPREVHTLLMREFLPDAGSYRTTGVRVGPYIKPDPVRVPDMMDEWAERVEAIVGCEPLPSEDERREAVWGLHCEYENIHPWVDGNGRSGRLLMVNHAIVMGLEPWIIHYGEEQDYYRRIEAHESHSWGEGQVTRDNHVEALVRTIMAMDELAKKENS